VRAVCTNAGWLWKGLWAIFYRFYDAESAPYPAKSARRSPIGSDGSKPGAGVLVLTRFVHARRLLPEAEQKPSLASKKIP